MNKSVNKRLQRMDNELRLLLKELEPYSEAKLNEKPKADAWSVFQVMHHMIKVERSSMAYVTKKLSYQPVLKKVGVKSGIIRVATKALASVPIKIKAPAVVGEDLPPHSTFWEVVKEYKDVRSELQRFLEEMPTDMFDKEIYKHPLTGRMSLNGMLQFLEGHFSRHRKQIRKTLKKVDAVKQL